MLTGILIGAGIMLTYLAIGALASRYIKHLGRQVPDQEASDSNPPLK